MILQPLRLAVALSLVLAVLPPAAAATRDDPARWLQCRGTPLFDWLQPTLPAADRESAPVEIDAATVDVSGKDIYRLEGAVRLSRADQRLAAERLDYTHSSTAYRASGGVRYQDAGIAVAASSLEGNIQADRSAMQEVRYQLIAARGNGEAASARIEGPLGSFDAVSYSTCDPERPSWVLRAASMELDRESGFGAMRDATLRIGDVPVLWLPYASFPIDDRRKSGFLYPSIGGGGDGGIDLRIPYYVNIAPEQDATLTARVLGRRGVMLGGEYRFVTANHQGQLDGEWLPDDDLSGRDRGSARYRHTGRAGERWVLLADLNHVSDDRYFEDFGDSLAIASTSLLPSVAMLRGRGEYWTATLSADDWRITDPLVADSAEPYRRLPRGQYRWQRALQDWLEVGVDAEAVAFDHSDRPGATRYDLTPSIALPFERAYGYLRPALAWRQTGYSLDREFADAGFAERSPSRGTAIASLDAALVFERETTLFGESMLQTLQPRLYYLNVPFEAQDDIPLLDTQELTFSMGQLFRTNRFTGADRQMDADQATFALTTRLFENDSGLERLSASLGQIRYFARQRVQLPGVPAQDASGSAYVGEVEFAVNERLGLGLTQQWDPEIDATTVTGLRSRWRGADGSLLNLAYRYRRDVLEQTDASFAVPLSSAWRAVGRWNYSLRDDSTLEGFLGAEWEGCCIAVRVLGRHYVRNREGEKNNALYVELELKGLASFGRDTGEFLERAIVGYTRD